ncbi:MAG: flagellar motor switch protein FliM [Verrucomicrobiota bacterium]
MNPPASPTPAPEAAAANAPAEIDVLTSRGVHERRRSDSIRACDFRQSGFLTPSELRRIRMRHEQFVRSLASRLSMFLRLEFLVQLGKLQIVGYQKFTETLPSPTHITLFKIDPLKGTGLLVLPPRLGLTLVDRLLGGPGQPPDSTRDLSEIEIALIDQAASLLLNEWCSHWPEMRELKPSLVGHENNSRYLQTAPPDTAMLVLTLDAGFGEQLEPIQMVFPYATVEPLMRLLTPAGLADAETAAARQAPFRWNNEFNDVPVPVVAEWQGLKLSAGDITRLKQGDVLMLDPACAAQVQLSLSHIPKFTGRPGTRSGKWAIELTGPAAKS